MNYRLVCSNNFFHFPDVRRREIAQYLELVPFYHMELCRTVRDLNYPRKTLAMSRPRCRCES